MIEVRLKRISPAEINEAYIKVITWFFSHPDQEISLTDLVQNVRISKTTANMIVRKLIKEGFLKLEELGRIWRISCNHEHKYNSSRKVAYNLESIYRSGIVEHVLSKIDNPKAIILFGSYRKGDDTEKSDIDIAVETLDDEEVNITTTGIIPELGYRKNIKVNILKFSRNKIDVNLFANIANGIVLYGFLEVRP